jgi:hypothetical protein
MRMRTYLSGCAEYRTDEEVARERAAEDAVRAAAAVEAEGAAREWERRHGQWKRAIQSEHERVTVTQLATRVPKVLYHLVKIWCVQHDTSVADFVTEALCHELEERQRGH